MISTTCKVIHEELHNVMLNNNEYILIIAQEINLLYTINSIHPIMFKNIDINNNFQIKTNSNHIIKKVRLCNLQTWMFVMQKQILAVVEHKRTSRGTIKIYSKSNRKSIKDIHLNKTFSNKLFVLSFALNYQLSLFEEGKYHSHINLLVLRINIFNCDYLNKVVFPFTIINQREATSEDMEFDKNIVVVYRIYRTYCIVYIIQLNDRYIKTSEVKLENSNNFKFQQTHRRLTVLNNNTIQLTFKEISNPKNQKKIFINL